MESAISLGVGLAQRSVYPPQTVVGLVRHNLANPDGQEALARCTLLSQYRGQTFALLRGACDHSIYVQRGTVMQS